MRNKELTYEGAVEYLEENPKYLKGVVKKKAIKNRSLKSDKGRVRRVKKYFEEVLNKHEYSEELKTKIEKETGKSMTLITGKNWINIPWVNGMVLSLVLVFCENEKERKNDEWAKSLPSKRKKKLKALNKEYNEFIKALADDIIMMGSDIVMKRHVVQVLKRALDPANRKVKIGDLYNKDKSFKMAAVLANARNGKVVIKAGKAKSKCVDYQKGRCRKNNCKFEHTCALCIGGKSHPLMDCHDWAGFYMWKLNRGGNGGNSRKRRFKQ